MQPSILWLAYIANIVILVPVCWSMFFGGGVGVVFDGRVPESAGLRIMVGSLWFAILFASIIGLSVPAMMAPILFVQIIYKSIWLIAFIRPAIRLDGWEGVPHGITLCFVGIVLTYPFILGAHLLRAPQDLVRFEHEVTTKASTADVWALWTDPATWACWDKGLAEASGPSKLERGSTGTITTKTGSVAKYSVTEMQDNVSYSFETNLPLARLRVRREITSQAPTQFTHEVSFHGLMRGPFARLLAPDFQRALPPTMERLASIAEQTEDCEARS